MSRHSVELKTNEQIILMRDAGLATAAALKAIRKAIRPGISTLELDAIAEATIIAKGGHSNFKLVPGYSHTICASINDEVVHGIPSASRILQAGDIISVDCGAEIGEWNGDSAITVIVPNEDGTQVDSDLVRARQTLSDVTEQSLWVGIAALAKAEYLN
jgi:methionyl aminopeptidase